MEGFSSVSTILVLPSRGYLYGMQLPEGKIGIKSMTTQEEKLLYGGRGSIADKMDTLLARCVQLPPDMAPKDLLTSDRFFLLVKVRILSLGENYPIMVKCSSCNEQFQKNINLDELPIKTYPEGKLVSEPFIVALPVSKKKIGFRLLRGKDEISQDKYRQQAKMRGEQDDNGYIFNMACRMLTVDEKPIDLLQAVQFVETMVSKDSLEYRYKTEEVETGVNSELVIECPSCGFTMEERLPFTEDFFRPRRKKV